MEFYNIFIMILIWGTISGLTFTGIGWIFGRFSEARGHYYLIYWQILLSILAFFLPVCYEVVCLFCQCTPKIHKFAVGLLRPEAAGLLAAVWLAGFLYRGVFICKNIILIYIIEKCNIPAEIEGLEEVYQKVCHVVKPCRKVFVFQNERIASPCLSGFFLKRVVLPYRNYSDLEITVSLMHELYHYKLRHLNWRHLMMLVSLIYWFCPAVYFLSVQLEEWEETLCDITCCERNGGMFQARDYYLIILGLLEESQKKSWGILQLTGSRHSLLVRLDRFQQYRQCSSTRRVCFFLLVLYGTIALVLTAAVFGLLYGLFLFYV